MKRHNEQLTGPREQQSTLKSALAKFARKLYKAHGSCKA